MADELESSEFNVVFFDTEGTYYVLTKLTILRMIINLIKMMIMMTVFIGKEVHAPMADNKVTVHDDVRLGDHKPNSHLPWPGIKLVAFVKTSALTTTITEQPNRYKLWSLLP